MQKKNKKASITLVVCLAITLVCMILANLLQTNFGSITVQKGTIDVSRDGLPPYSIPYKLYLPKGADAEHPLPAILCLHGYQNDSETSAAYAMEAAKRGMVALCIDEFGHGYNSLSMESRGWTSYKIQGQSADGNETTVKTGLSGADRFKLMMNFSTLSFFEGEAYSVNEEKRVAIDADADGLSDSSMGGIDAYRWLQAQPFVRSDQIGITGHSMGTWAAWSVAAACQDHAAIVLQCGEVFGDNIVDTDAVEFHNLLMLQARYDEFNYFRDYKQSTVNDSMLDSGIRTQFFTAHGRTNPQAFTWNTTYGDFAEGTARRVELLETNHRLTTHDAHAISTAMDWFATAFRVTGAIPSTRLSYLWKEVLVMIAMLAMMVSLCPMIILLSNLKPFASVIFDRTAIEREPKLMTRKQWWKHAWIAVAICACTYPFMTQLGHGLFPFPEHVFRMTIGNGFLIWYMTLALISILTAAISRRRNVRKGIANLDYYDLGLSRPEHASGVDWSLLLTSFVIAALAIAYFYLVVVFCQTVFQLDLRFIWPFFKQFSWVRFGQFLLYLPFFALFFVVNVGFRLFGTMRQVRDESKPVRNFIKCWMGNVFVLLGGLLIVILIEYIPFFLGFGPGADLLFGTTFGGPFMSALILLAPQFVFFTFLSTWFERKTGSVYVGAFISAMLAAWIVTGGSAMF